MGHIDDKKVAITGNSRFGCWICTMIKEDKSLKNFIDKGCKELESLRDFRNWLLDIRNNPEYRDKKRSSVNTVQDYFAQKQLLRIIFKQLFCWKTRRMRKQLYVAIRILEDSMVFKLKTSKKLWRYINI